MPEYYTWVNYSINQSEEIGEKQLSDFGSRGGQISPLRHIPLYCSFMKNITEKCLDGA